MMVEHSSFEDRHDGFVDAIRHSYRDGQYLREVHSLEPHVEEVLAKMRARKLQPLVGPQDTVFEFGVGTALNLRYLNCRRKVGYDVGDMSAACCHRHGVEYVVDLADLSKQTFSVVLCHHTLEHVTSPYEILDQLKHLLRPRGRLLLFVPFEMNRRYRRYQPGDRNHHLFSWNALTCGNLVTAVGLGIEHVSIRSYGYQQRLAPLAKFGMPWYRLALWVAGLLRPCAEIQLVARRRD